ETSEVWPALTARRRADPNFGLLMDTDTTRSLRCVVVTPERAVLDEPADFVVLPMYDGELGVLPGRAPLIGRLGHRGLRVQRDGHTRRFFVDEGFAQVRANVVTVLTPRAVRAEDIDREAAAQALQAALRPTLTHDVRKDRIKALERARAELRVAQRAQG